MKGFKSIYLIIGILFFSCEKESEVEKIAFTDIQPDMSITTYGNSSNINLYENNIKYAVLSPWVSDSIFSLALSKTSLDLNGDGIKDFTLEVSHELKDVSENVLYDRFLVKFNSENLSQISMADKEMGYTKSYEFNQEIDTTTFTFANTALTDNLDGFIVNIRDNDNFKLFGDYYIATRLLVDEKQYYGWLHLKAEFFTLTICDYAISNEPGILLRIGEF